MVVRSVCEWPWSFRPPYLQPQVLYDPILTFKCEIHLYLLVILTRLLIILFMKVWLLLFSLIALATSLSCEAYILKMVHLYYNDKPQFNKEAVVYTASSGKLVDDLGLPNTCVKSPARAYFTAEVNAVGVENEYTAYLGVCFSSKCDEEDMNQNGAIIINTFLNVSVFDNTTITFYQPKLESQTTTGAVVFLILLIILVLIAMKDGVQKMIKGCIKETKTDDEQSSKYEIQFAEDYDPTLLMIQEKEGFFKRQCIFTKLGEYLTPQQSTKIVAFSSIRILSVPLAFYGYMFYLCNLGSNNYFSFNKQIYSEFFSKLALASYYLPDVLFFISGFIFAKKAFYLIEIENKPVRPLLSLLWKKIVRLYPLYWVIIIIYWQISPTLHAGPVWYEYEQEAAQCNSGWWRVLLLIDNWFENGCYNFTWFIPVQFQLTLVNVVILLAFAHKKKIGLAALIFALIGSWVLVLTISSPLPSSLETTLSYSAQKYFKSTYSHLPFYLFGILNAYLAQNEKVKSVFQKLTENNILKVIMLIIGGFFIILIVDRPKVWEKVLGFELGLARTGMFIGLYLFMFWGIFGGGKTRKTMIHKISALSLGALLIGGFVVSSSFWSGLTFPYLDGLFLLEYSLTNYLISLPVGAFVAALIWPKPAKEETVIL